MPAFTSSKKAQLAVYALSCVFIWAAGFVVGDSHAAQLAVVKYKYPDDYVREADIRQACSAWFALDAPGRPSPRLYTPSFQEGLWGAYGAATGTDIEESVWAYGNAVMGTRPLVEDELSAYASNIEFICKQKKGGSDITEPQQSEAPDEAEAPEHPDHTEDAEAAEAAETK